MFKLGLPDLPAHAPKIAELLRQQGSAFVEFEKPGDSYLVLLALGPGQGHLAFTSFGRNVALIVPLGSDPISLGYLQQKCPNAALGDLEPLALLISSVKRELHRASDS